MLRSLQEGRTTMICVLCMLAMFCQGCSGIGKNYSFITPTPFYPTPTPFVTPVVCAGALQDDPSLTQVSQTVPVGSNAALGFQVRLPTWLPSDLTWHQAEILSSGPKDSQAHYLVVPLFTALYGIWVSTKSSIPPEMHDHLALNETTDTLTALTGISYYTIGNFTIHDHTSVQIGRRTGTLFHLMTDVQDVKNYPVTALLWKDMGVTLRLTASTMNGFSFLNTKDMERTYFSPPASVIDSWLQGDDATLLKIASSITVYTGCG